MSFKFSSYEETRGSSSKTDQYYIAENLGGPKCVVKFKENALELIKFFILNTESVDSWCLKFLEFQYFFFGQQKK